MSFYFHELWVGFITQQLIKQCYSLSIEECDGCKNGKKSILLHSHEWLSLLEKIEIHFEAAKNYTIQPGRK